MPRFALLLAVALVATAAHALGVIEAPCIVVGQYRFDAATMPDDVHERVAAALDG